MSIKKSLALLNSVVVLSIIVTGFMVLRLGFSVKDLYRMETQRNITLELGEELRNSSKNLTAFVRMYAATANPEAERAYQAVLDERSGQTPRLSSRPIAPGQRVALLDLMRQYGVTAQELGKVDEANRLSNALVPLEVEAMEAVKGRFKDSSGGFTLTREPDRSFALSLVFGAAYEGQVKKIMSPLDDFVKMLDTRTAGAVDAVMQEVRLNQIVVFSCLFFVFCAIGFSAWYVHRRVSLPLDETADFADRVSNGQLDSSLPVSNQDEIGHLRTSLNNMVGHMRARIADAEQALAQARAKEQEAFAARSSAEEALGKADAAAQQMRHVAERLGAVVSAIGEASGSLSAQVVQSEQGASEQAARIAETASAMDEMNATVTAVAQNADHATAVSQDAMTRARDGASIVNQVLTSMGTVQEQTNTLREDMDYLTRQAEDIGEVMSVISDIADQTNLLALNAAIEAARAGEAGRGFAVVADEVRKLAEKTMGATGQVARAVQGIQEGARRNMSHMEKSVTIIKDTTSLAGKSGAVLEEIVRLVGEAHKEVAAITLAAREQTTASEAITESMGQVNNVAQVTSQTMHEAREVVSGLSDQLRHMTALTEELGSRS